MSFRIYLQVQASASGTGALGNRRVRTAISGFSEFAESWWSVQPSSIRFEDASDKAGINFTHSFGSAQLGSLLEGTGAGCVWLDYNNDGVA